jgi:hypothetical protein
MSNRFQVKYPLFLLDLTNISMEIHSVGAEEFRADRQTDTTKLTAAFRNSAKAPKLWVCIRSSECV